MRPLAKPRLVDKDQKSFRYLSNGSNLSNRWCQNEGGYGVVTRDKGGIQPMLSKFRTNSAFHIKVSLFSAESSTKYRNNEQSGEQMRLSIYLILATFLFTYQDRLFARISIAPYVSIKSTKNVTPGASKDSETEKLKQREEYGIRASIGMGRFFKAQLSVGQSKLSSSEKVSDLKDEYNEIDFASEFEIDTSDPESSLKMTETQQLGKLSLVFDPSFSIFILRAKAGVTARQRIIKTEQSGQNSQEKTYGPSYYPHSAAGVGVKLFRRTFLMVEYELLHYAYPPSIEPFERELTVSYSISI